MTALVLYALRQNINLFYAPQELLAANVTPQVRVRIGGMVKKDSVKQAKDLTVSFVVTDFKQDIIVTYQGVLPDLFREGQGVVALGTLGVDKVFRAEQILAKHDEKYMPPNISGQ